MVLLPSTDSKVRVLLLLCAAGAFISVGLSIGSAVGYVGIYGSYATHKLAQSPVVRWDDFVARHHQESSLPPEAVSRGKYGAYRRNLDYRYHETYSNERILLQDQIIDSMLMEAPSVPGNCSKVESPWMVFTAGSMGAGKTHTIKLLHDKGRFPLDMFTVIDPDRIRWSLPEFSNLVVTRAELAGELTRKEAGTIAEILVSAAIERGHNILVDGSLRDAEWYSQYISDLRTSHPNLRIAILHVTAPREIVLQRAMSRGKITGRVVPRDLLEESMDQVPKSVEILRPLVDFSVDIFNGGGDDVKIVSNEIDWLVFRSQWDQSCRSPS